MRPLYRLRQFWQGITAQPLSAAEQAEIGRWLTPAERDLFSNLSLNDQQHSWRVLQMLLAAGHEQPPLLKAALLHDVGKTTVNLTLIDRSLVVLGQLFWVKKARQWGERPLDQTARWQRPFVVRSQHAAWGAEMLVGAGSDPQTIDLVRRHQDKPAGQEPDMDRLLRLLQWADNQN